MQEKPGWDGLCFANKQLQNLSFKQQWFMSLSQHMRTVRLLIGYPCWWSSLLPDRCQCQSEEWAVEAPTLAINCTGLEAA